VDEDVRWIITDQELKAFKSLSMTKSATTSLKHSGSGATLTRFPGE